MTDLNSIPMQPHIIRLRRPWEKALIGQEGSERIDVPEPVGETAADGVTVRYRRKFNRPTGLGEQSVVHLKVDGWHGQLVSVSLNGQSIQPEGPSVDADITAILAPQNQVEVQLRDHGQQPVALSGEVTLEIS